MLDSPCKTCKGGKLTHNLCKDKCKRYANYKNELEKVKKANKEIFFVRRIARRRKSG